MGYACLGWRIRKIGESGGAMHPRNYQGCNFLIVHDHTKDRRQSSYLFISGRNSYESLMKKCRNFAQERGWKLSEQVDNLDEVLVRSALPTVRENSIWDVPNALDNIKYVWRAGKAFHTNGEDSNLNIFTDTAGEDGEPQAVEVKEEPVDLGDIMFPDPGLGVVLAATVMEGQWKVRVWGYGTAKRGVDDVTKSYAAHAARSDNAKSSPMLKTKMFLGGGITLFVSGLPIYYGLVPGLYPIASLPMFILSAVLTGIWGVMGYKSPVRKKMFSKSITPAKIRKLLSNKIRNVWSKKTNNKGIVIELPKGVSFASYLDVERDGNIVPDMGGVMVGYDETGYEMRLPDRDRYKNAVFIGSPGAGKTTALLNISGGDMMRRKSGQKHSIVWFETKREGAARLISMARSVGVEPLYIAAGGTTGPQIRFLDWQDTKADAGALTEAFVAAFDPSSIKEQSRDVFAALFGFAALVWPDQLKRVGVEEAPNLMRTAWILAGGAGWKKALALVKEVENTSENKEAVKAAGERLSPYIHISDRDKELKVSPARNKLNRVKDLPVWNLDLTRSVYSWQDIMESEVPVIVDVSTFDDPSLAGYSEELVRILLPIAFWTCWAVAKKHCSSWGEEKKSVSLYCDEASNLAYNSGVILSEISAQGRSHGINLMLGAQGWTQLAEKTQLAFREAGNKFYFSTDDPVSAEALAQDFLVGDKYNAASITKLVPFEALSVIKIGGERFGPLVISIPSEKKWDTKKAWTHPTASAA